MTATGPGRLRELEEAVANLITDVTGLRARLDALEAKPPARDPASTTAAATQAATPASTSGRRREIAPVKAFGFTQDQP